MASRIYLETSVISYLAARPSDNAVNASRQYFSYQLWQRRDRLGLVISDAVLMEASAGDQQAVSNRLVFCNALPRLDLPVDALKLAEQLVAMQAVPSGAFTDAMHIAIAALHEVSLIASWNFRHIAGPLARRRIEHALASLDQYVPAIATPEEIMEGSP